MSYIVNIPTALPDNHNFEFIQKAARFVREKYDIDESTSVGDRLEKELDIVIIKTPNLTHDAPSEHVYIVDFKTEMNYTYQMLRWS
jgi:hypothetical protein